jgi:mannose-6-phosphate isomerase-like protein (cupin superfamily)
MIHKKDSLFMQAFEILNLIEQQRQQSSAYFEFLRVPALSMGLYSLPANTFDAQLPHSEDEVYYVVSGRAEILVGEENRAIEAGSIVFVAATVEHRFHSISEDLTVLVFFAPAEYTRKQMGLEKQA